MNAISNYTSARNQRAQLVQARRRRFLTAVVASSLAAATLSMSVPVVSAQDGEPTELDGMAAQGAVAEQGLGEVFDGLLNDSDNPAGPDDPGGSDEAAESSTRAAAPNTDSCPRALLPPEPVTTSEVVAPGQESPVPLPEVQNTDCGVHAPEGFEVDDDVRAASWIISDLDTGEVVAAKDPHGRYRPASILKVLIALVAIDELDLKKTVTGTDEDAAIDGSAVGIGPGGRYTIEQLLQGLVMASGNDAAHALAQQLGGDEETLKKINQLALNLGARSTFAASYSGLDAPGMSTSAADMALLYTAAFENPTFTRLVGTENVEFPGYGDLEGYELWNDNGLFMNDPDGIGGKTGYTDDAHHTFVGALDRDGRRLMAVILDTTVDHGPRAWQQAQLLLNEAYDVPAGEGVTTLDDIKLVGMDASDADAEISADEAARAADNAPEAADAQAATDAAAAESHNQPGWISWLIVAGVAALVIAVISSLLLLRRPNGRGRHAAH
ncbi:MAG: serine hydrolase [Corynebacterium casei]|uniref:D-alanyl-D-alanine carboxypeptidase family protein n=1 Tax=Corynebacterium casei TaxID=160386 RepID=UPI0026475110|nr:serine hydrolase [Corynebacterium casei]MDN6627217.1 serine hydrolase [Corynebacterium casei]